MPKKTTEFIFSIYSLRTMIRKLSLDQKIKLNKWLYNTMKAQLKKEQLNISMESKEVR